MTSIEQFLALIEHRAEYVRLARAFVLWHDADDCVQLGFLNAWSHLQQYDPAVGNMSGWLRTVVINECLQLRRRYLRRRETEFLLHTPARGPNPEQVCRAMEILREVERLPALYRRVILHRLVQIEADAESAAAIGCTESAWKNRLHRGRTALAARI